MLAMQQDLSMSNMADTCSIGTRSFKSKKTWFKLQDCGIYSTWKKKETLPSLHYINVGLKSEESKGVRKLLIKLPEV